MYINDPKPLVVLVNKNSASGAEIIAAGVRANGVGTVMGAQTAGCVGIGQPRELPDGGLLLVTIARMEDAKTGEQLNGPGKGVVPDKLVAADTNTANDNQRLAADAFITSGGKS
jgi:carboxyl-terminal processing protease